jgi:polyhydroxybutyrate depolymerase
MDAESTIDAPVIFSFHGGGGTAIANMEYSGFRQIAESEKFILVYPQGQYFSDKDSTGWIFNENNNITDDLFFISEVIDWLYQNKNINLDRIYATGFSVGAIMSYDLACKLSNKIAAAAPVAGTMSTETFETCRPEKSKSIIHIHGESDSVLSPNGNEYIKSFDESLQFWSDFNQCSTSSTSNISDSNDDGYSGTSIIYQNCSNQVLVNGILLENFGHQWPSTNDQKNESDIDAASYIWSFLKKFDVDGFIE